eukprot:scaffold660382_cov59-Prasinocladus_malaysianus.AAC.1
MASHPASVMNPPDDLRATSLISTDGHGRLQQGARTPAERLQKLTKPIVTTRARTQNRPGRRCTFILHPEEAVD